MKFKKLDLSGLTPEERKRVERALAPRRDTMLALKFRAEDVARWIGATETFVDSMTLTKWMQSVLDEAAKQRPVEIPRIDWDASSRNEKLSRRFPQASVDAWKAAAEQSGVLLTRWMEWHLNTACDRRKR